MTAHIDNTDIALKDGERVHATLNYEEGLSLVSDGNSRWERGGDTFYFIVNEQYEEPSGASI